VADQEGLDQLRGLVERRARSVPPPRRPRQVEESKQSTPTTESGELPAAEADEADSESRGSGGPEPAWEGPSVVPPPILAATPVPDEHSVEAAAPPAPSPAPEPPPAQFPQSGDLGARSAGTGTEPTANLTLRIRQSLDLRLAELLHSLRREGVRSSKKELIEMCLSELPLEPSEHLRARLRAYRDIVPKEPL